MVKGIEIELLVQDLLRAFQARAEDMGLPYEGTLHPPADPEDIARYAGSFPPSYRVFLSLHNGWEGFLDVFTLIGASGAHTRKAQDDIRDTIRIFQERWRNLSGEKAEEMARQFDGSPTLDGDTEIDAHIYLPHMLPFGTDFAGSLFYFHPGLIDAAGEMPVVYRDQTGEIVKRYDDFVSFLQQELAFIRKELGDA